MFNESTLRMTGFINLIWLWPDSFKVAALQTQQSIEEDILSFNNLNFFEIEHYSG